MNAARHAPPRTARASTDVFSAVADPTRREILELLSQRECSVNELCERFDVSQPAISQHLRVLREAELVRVRVEGRFRFYQLEAHALREVYDWAAHYQRFWQAKLDALGQVIAAQHLKKKRP
jgi:DNA-binding transcriptional ArsR family regulator